MEVSKTENFRDDGFFIFEFNKNKIYFDFEKRFRYYPSYQKFQFNELGQFERKIKKSEILLSIQCSLDETGFVFAWHEDFLCEKIQNVKSITKTGFENNGKRFTKSFLKYHIKKFHIFIKFFYIISK